MDHYAVLGNPIAHSKSPQIHALFAKQTQQEMSYQTMLVPLDGLANALKEFQAAGGKGVNITLPFKNEAFSLVDTHSERAQLAQAINTIKFNDDGSRFGDNTDGIGLVRDITLNLHFPITDKKILIMGAGGAVRGVIGPLLEQHPTELIIANRTLSKAVELANYFSKISPVKALGFQDLPHHYFDLIINATSASVAGETLDLPANLLLPNALCYDMMYGRDTPFLAWGKSQGATVSDGLGMLVEQAAEAFYIWRGVRPDTRQILVQL